MARIFIICIFSTIAAFGQPIPVATIGSAAAPPNTQGAINVKSFGAVGDGVHNETAAIQNAIDSAQSGDIVFVPAGNYLTGAIRMKNGVEIRCASMRGSTFLADTKDIVMFTLSAVSSSGISNCSISGNGNTGVRFLEINTYPSTNNRFRDIYVHHIDSGIRTSDTYFDTFDNVRIFQPRVSAFVFEHNSNAITCNNCSTISGSPGAIGLSVHNSGAFVFNGGTLEGTVSTSLYQLNAATFIGTYWENTGGVNPGAWVNIGTSRGTQTGGINFIGCNFGVGANYALHIVQVSGLVATGNSINTKRAAFYIDTRNNSPKNGLDLDGNQFNVNAAGYDPATILSFSGEPDNSLNSNINRDVVNPLLFTATPEPPDASIRNTQGVIYFDSKQRLWYKYKNSSGSVRRWLLGSDALYYNPESISADSSLSYVLDGVDGAVLSGNGGVRLRVGSAGGTCIGQFGGSTKGDRSLFSSIGLGLNDCAPPADATVHVMNNTRDSATTFDVQAGDSQASKPLARFKDNMGNVTAQINPDGSGHQTGVPFANLPKPTSGTIIYCTDCRNIQDGVPAGSTAAGGGTGAFLAGVSSGWRIMN
jgi:hypothetical protein